MRKTFLSLLACSLAILPASGHNNYFLPGDAFFSVSLPESLIEAWSASKVKSFSFDYDRFDGQFFACGNIGYSVLVIEDINPERRAGLAEAYWRYASGTRPTYRQEGNDGKSDLQQINSVVALIYAKSYDLRLPVGLKFNEHWQEEGAGKYGGFYESARAVMLDWRMAASVPALPVREKLTPDAHLAENYEAAAAHVINTPLHISARDIQIVLVGFAQQEHSAVTQRCPNLQSILDAEEYAEYTVVTNERIRSFRCDENGTWEETVIKLPVPSGDSWIPRSRPAPPQPSK